MVGTHYDIGFVFNDVGYYSSDLTVNVNVGFYIKQ